MVFRQGWPRKPSHEVECKCSHPRVAHYTRDGHCAFPGCGCLEYRPKGNANFPNKRARCDHGHAHDSGEEIRHCAELEYRRRAGDIAKFDAQVVVDLLGPSGSVVGTYKVDFVVTHVDGAIEYQEVKGSHLFKKTAWPLKWALLMDKHKGDKMVKFRVIIAS